MTHSSSIACRNRIGRIIPSFHSYAPTTVSRHKSCIIIITILLIMMVVVVDGASTTSSSSEYDDTLITDGSPVYYAVLFPWFIQIIGVMIFFLKTQYEFPIPYSALMFICGSICGIGTILRYQHLESISNDNEMNMMESIATNTTSSSTTNTGSESNMIINMLDQLSISILQWSDINSSVLLLVFLPGLLFRDAIEVNFPLFYKAIFQLLLLAFPLVLVGAAMTAGVGKYVLVYYNESWPLSLWMVLGSILASTDPIAVSSILKALGAPPRLQIHITGESLLNDGSALVFYVIFTEQYLADLNLSSPVSLVDGIILFCRMAFGGCTIGIMFAIGLLYLLHIMDTRLEPEYNIVQVVAALSIAYLSFYVAEKVCHMSGIIACVVCGISVRAIGKGLIRDHHLMDSYLALMEHLLNTLLFALGGVVWGKVVGEGNLHYTDWFYLIIFYIFIILIRFIQIGLFYPIISKIGLKTDWKEAIFLAYGGIRGAVGVALALALKGSVVPLTDNPITEDQIKSLNFLAGGVTLLTLLINGTTAGPILKKLGLTRPVISRKQAIRLFESSAKEFITEEYKILTSQTRFSRTNFKVIKAHVPFVTKLATKKRRNGMLSSATESERLGTVSESDGLGSISESERLPLDVIDTNGGLSTRSTTVASLDQVDLNGINPVSSNSMQDSHHGSRHERQVSSRSIFQDSQDGDDAMRNSQHLKRIMSVRSVGTDEQLISVRQLYLELVSQAYVSLALHDTDHHHHEIHHDEGISAELLRQSVAFAVTDINTQQPIHDWDFAHYDDGPVSMVRWYENIFMSSHDRKLALEYQSRRNTVLRSIAFIEAHHIAEQRLKTLISATALATNPLLQEEMNRNVSDDNKNDVEGIPANGGIDVDGNDPEKQASASSRVHLDASIDIVLKESLQQVKEAQKVLNAIPNLEIQRITSHYVCTILLKRLTTFVEQHVADAALTKKEGMIYLKQIDRNLKHSYTCTAGHSNQSDLREFMNSGLSKHNHAVSQDRSDAAQRVTTVMKAYLYKK